MSVVAEYLAEISKAADGHICVYRGQAGARWKLESGAERRIAKALDEEAEVVPSRALKAYHDDLLRDARKMGFGIIDGRPLKDMELLTELQHFGAATCLLDFTESALVALYFASLPKPETDGKIFILPSPPLKRVAEDEEIEHVIERSQPAKFKPIMHGSAERRIIKQAGLFIVGLSDKAEDLKTIEIKAGDKKDILTELEEKYQISADTLFIDLNGFAENRSTKRPLQEYYTFFYKGLQAQDNNKSEEAIADYDEAIRLKPDFAGAYRNRGVAKARLRMYGEAIADFDEAIRLNPGFAGAFNNRGAAKAKLGLLAEAIGDYDQAISLKPDYALAFRNRGNAKAKLDKPADPIADLEQARDLFTAQGQSEDAANAQAAINDIKHQ